MGWLLLLLALLPPVVAVACLVLPHRLCAAVTLASGLVCLVAVLRLVPTVGDGVVSIGFLRVDALSVVFLLPTGLLYAAAAAYSIGYLKEEDGGVRTTRYNRLFFIGFNAFAWSMLCAPMTDGLALLWIAVEITTVISALLVALDNTDGATEAAWKYVLIASCGLGIGLLATIVMYYAGAQPLGQSYDLSFAPLVAHSAQLPATPVRLAFVLAVVGFGTKVGLVPMHTWLPDAHAEAPTPVSALLSGSLLAVSFYAILRYYQVTRLAVGDDFPQRVLLVFGVASLLLAGLSLLQQTDVKRLLAYSSVEHMGILAIGVSLGAPLALVGVLLHVLAHAAAKGNAFMGAGVVVRAYQTKSLTTLRGILDRLPWTGPIFLTSILALCALPPFGLFRSEFDIVAGGIDAGHDPAAVILVVLVTMAFLGLLGSVATPAFSSYPAALARPAPADRVVEAATMSVVAGDPPGPRPLRASGEAAWLGDQEPPRGSEPSGWMVAPMLVGIVVLLLLGIHPPAALADLLNTAASQLSGAVSR